MKKNLRSLGLFLFCLTIHPTSYATNGYFSHGTGIKNKAMAGAGVAMPQDALAGATNPAGMAFVGNRFDIGTTLFSPDRDYSSSSSLANGNGGAFTIGPDSDTSDDKWFLLPSFGINKQLTDNTSIGLSLYGNGGLNTSYDDGSATFDPTGMMGAGMQFPGTLGAGTTGVDLFQIFLNLSLSHKLNQDVAVGISPLFVVQGFRANGLDSFGGFTKSFVESGFTSPAEDLTGNGQEYSFGGGVQVGALIKNISDVVDFGISYRSKIYMQKFDKYSDLFAENGDFDIPPTLWAGFAFHPTNSLTFLFDFQRIWYEEVESISNEIQNLFACPSAGLGGTDIESCLGGDNGGGFGWEDINILKFGIQWEQSNQNIFRVGYSHSDQPISSDQVLFNILAPGVIENHITAGYTRVLSDDSEINFLLMHALKESVEGTNAFDPTQTIEIEMQQFEAGISWSKKF